MIDLVTTLFEYWTTVIFIFDVLFLLLLSLLAILCLWCPLKSSVADQIRPPVQPNGQSVALSIVLTLDLVLWSCGVAPAAVSAVDFFGVTEIGSTEPGLNVIDDVTYLWG